MIHDELLAERDALRAEVERLRARLAEQSPTDHDHASELAAAVRAWSAYLREGRSDDRSTLTATAADGDGTTESPSGE
jgi:hypothetical protein